MFIVTFSNFSSISWLPDLLGEENLDRYNYRLINPIAVGKCHETLKIEAGIETWIHWSGVYFVVRSQQSQKHSDSSIQALENILMIQGRGYAVLCCFSPPFIYDLFVHTSLQVISLDFILFILLSYVTVYRWHFNWVFFGYYFDQCPHYTCSKLLEKKRFIRVTMK